MKVMLFNGSPRKSGNTGTLLKKTAEGAKLAGADDAKTIHLYDYDYKGCYSCFQCKKIGGSSYGKCGIKDGITSVIEEARQADVLIFGSPIYFGNLSGMMRNFLERLLFAAFVYDEAYSSLWQKEVKSGMIYTQNRASNEAYLDAMDYSVEFFLRCVFGNVESMYSMDTYQFNDYSKYFCPAFDEAQKRQVRDTVLDVYKRQLQGPFLSASHRITVINTGALHFIYTGF